jgi:peptide-methionine (S)-S-oxide reductase
MPSAADTLPGREEPLTIPDRHFVNGAPLRAPWPDGTKTAVFAMGCFWGAEKHFWETPGIVSTAVGYAGGSTPNATYREVCTGRTGHAEAVLVAYDPSRVSYEELLRIFWENHDPTQGMRQGNDIGTQYRSAIYTLDDEQLRAATASREIFQERLKAAGFGAITTEIAPSPAFFYAEEYHQQYLAKNPRGYCPNHATGVNLPDDFVVTPLQYVD